MAVSLPVSVGAQTLSSIGFTPLAGTSWSGSSVRLNFGAELGMGTVTFQQIGSGGFEVVSAGTTYNDSQFSSDNGPTDLGGGLLFAPSQEVVFRTLPGSGPDPGGFRMTVSLDEGTFAEGSVFSLRSIGRNTTGGYQTLTLVSGLSAAYPVQLPTDDVWGPPPDLVETSPGVYQTVAAGSNSKGRAFGINGGSFTVDLVGNYLGGGEAFTIAVPVPEPSGLALVSIGIAGVMLRRKR